MKVEGGINFNIRIAGDNSQTVEVDIVSHFPDVFRHFTKDDFIVAGLGTQSSGSTGGWYGMSVEVSDYDSIRGVLILKGTRYYGGGGSGSYPGDWTQIEGEIYVINHK